MDNEQGITDEGIPDHEDGPWAEGWAERCGFNKGSSIVINSDNPITTAALEMWGEKTQINILLEECAEVIQAIAHYKRGRCGTYTIAAEIADVLVSIQSVAKCYNLVPEINSQMNKKMLRLAVRLEEFEKHHE